VFSFEPSQRYNLYTSDDGKQQMKLIIVAPPTVIENNTKKNIAINGGVLLSYLELKGI